ncbi:MAG: ribose-5-phosphate isomerase RpiA [Jannaschia sp.]
MGEILDPTDRAKDAAARRALELVEDGMDLGLGTGSTAVFMVRRLGRMVREDGLRVRAVATSTRTAELARSCGVDVTTLDEVPQLDLTLDGADEFDPALNLIKGAGGALLREKIVAAASDRMVVMADASKAVATLGAFTLPVEVVPFGARATEEAIRTALATLDVDGREMTWRQDGAERFRTDEGNLILDLDLGRIGDAPAVSRTLLAIPGVVETGLFLGLCDAVVIGASDGSAELRRAGKSPRAGATGDGVHAGIAG